MEITKKQESTEAYHALRDDVQFRVWGFWTCCWREVVVRGDWPAVCSKERQDVICHEMMQQDAMGKNATTG
jgi:hypothetical protein